MSKPKQVSKAMMDALNGLKYNFKLKKAKTIVGLMEDVLDEEHLTEYLASLNNTLKFEQAIIDYVVWNKDVFEAEKPKKWIVRSKESECLLDTWYLKNDGGVYRLMSCEEYWAYKFDTKEEAEKWTNPQTEVVEVEA